MEMVGAIRKVFKKCFIFSKGYATKTRFNNSTARSEGDVTNCKLSEIVGRFNSETALQIRLVFPYRRGLIKIRWLALSMINFTFTKSAARLVKYSPSTIEPYLKTLSIFISFKAYCDYEKFRNEIFRSKKSDIKNSK
jgi:hypothetical protein